MLIAMTYYEILHSRSKDAWQSNAIHEKRDGHYALQLRYGCVRAVSVAESVIACNSLIEEPIILHYQRE